MFQFSWFHKKWTGSRQKFDKRDFENRRFVLQKNVLINFFSQCFTRRSFIDICIDTAKLRCFQWTTYSRVYSLSRSFGCARDIGNKVIAFICAKVPIANTPLVVCDVILQEFYCRSS